MKVYLVCWTTSAVSEPEYYVEKAFAKKEDAKKFITKEPPGEGSYYIVGSDDNNGYWIEEFEIE
ncbi:hypothetical protein LCGC14_1571790 [marine sediment metagenome]|uniref:Uncharacterized protein n=1 Tax=marine sediment metagenome TaxID=412755 RepID=A0A0F9J5Q5_9ZZZZ